MAEFTNIPVTTFDFEKNPEPSRVIGVANYNNETGHLEIKLGPELQEFISGRLIDGKPMQFSLSVMGLASVRD